MDPLLLPIPQACAALGIGRSKLYELIAAGELTTRHIGKRTLLSSEDLKLFAARLAKPKSELTAASQPEAL